MDVKKFNKEVSNLIKKSDNKFGFIQPEAAKELHNQMTEVANKVKVCVDECLLICHEQNLLGSDNIVFGEYLLDMSKSMWVNMMSQPLETSTTQPGE